jgi:putative hydrolase of the HAD superfamily
MKKWLLFDAMGVVFTVGDDTNDLLVPFVQRLNGGISQQDINEQYMKASLGEISSQQFWANVGLSKYYPDIEKEYLDTQLTLDEDCILAFDKLSEKYNLGIISNDLSEWSEFLRSKFGLNKYMKLSIISGDVGIRKPDKRIFQLLSKYNIAYNDCVFVDDREKNLKPASDLGINTILFNRDNVVTEYQNTVNSFAELESICDKLLG